MSLLQLLKDTETFKKKLLPKYVDLGTSLALFYVEPLKKFMKHLLDVQGIDSNTYQNSLRTNLETLLNTANHHYISPEVLKIIPKVKYYNDINHNFKRSVNSVSSSFSSDKTYNASKSFIKEIDKKYKLGLIDGPAVYTLDKSVLENVAEKLAEKLALHNSKNMDHGESIPIAEASGCTGPIGYGVPTGPVEPVETYGFIKYGDDTDKLSDFVVDDDVSTLTKPQYYDNPSIEEAREAADKMVALGLLDDDQNSIMTQEKEFLTMNRGLFILLSKSLKSRTNKKASSKVKSTPSKVTSKKKIPLKPNIIDGANKTRHKRRT